MQSHSCKNATLALIRTIPPVTIDKAAVGYELL